MVMGGAFGTKENLDKMSIYRQIYSLYMNHSRSVDVSVRSQKSKSHVDFFYLHLLYRLKYFGFSLYYSIFF